MASLLSFRDGVKNFCSKYDRIVVPVVKFILALLMYWSIVHITGGHNETVSSGLVIFLLAVVGAFVPDGLTYALGGIVAFMNYFSANKEIGISFCNHIFNYVLYLYTVFPENDMGYHVCAASVHYEDAVLFADSGGYVCGTGGDYTDCIWCNFLLFFVGCVKLSGRTCKKQLIPRTCWKVTNIYSSI